MLREFFAGVSIEIHFVVMKLQSEFRKASDSFATFNLLHANPPRVLFLAVPVPEPGLCEGYVIPTFERRV